MSEFLDFLTGIFIIAFALGCAIALICLPVVLLAKWIIL